MSSRSNNNVGNFVTSIFNKPPQNERPQQSLAVGGRSNNIAQSSVETYSGGGSDVVRSFPPLTHDDKLVIEELAVVAMEELTELAKHGSPLWIPGYSSEILNIDDYTKAFPMLKGPKPLGFRTEASRESVVVIMNHINLIEILMDVNQWMAMFSDIVTRGMTLEVLSGGVAGNYNGYLQVMSAEFQIPSPIIPTRENYFMRYCKKQKEGSWAVVDVSLDHLQPSSTLRSRRRPSGCIIQELPYGYSKVIQILLFQLNGQHIVLNYGTNTLSDIVKKMTLNDIILLVIDICWGV